MHAPPIKSLLVGLSLVAACTGAGDLDYGECEDGTCDEFDRWRTPEECFQRSATMDEYAVCLGAINDRIVGDLDTIEALDALDAYRASAQFVDGSAGNQFIWDQIRPVGFNASVENAAYLMLTTPPSGFDELADPRLDFVPVDCLESYRTVAERASREERLDMLWALSDCTQRVADEQFEGLVVPALQEVLGDSTGSTIGDMVLARSYDYIVSATDVCVASFPSVDSTDWRISFAACELMTRVGWLDMVAGFVAQYYEVGECTPTENDCTDAIDNDCDGLLDEEDECSADSCGDTHCTGVETAATCPADCP